STSTTHEVAAAPPASDPPASEKLLAPGVAVTTPPVHVVDALAGLATVNPSPPIVVRLSVNAMPVSAAAFAARVIVTRRRDRPPATTGVGENAFAAVSTPVTTSWPVSVTEFAPPDVWTPLTAMVFVRVPVDR